MKDYFKTPIKSLSDAEGFFFQLEQDDLLYHPEDAPEQIYNAHGRIFTDAECVLIRARINEVYEFMDDPCEYILTLDTYRTITDDERMTGRK